MKTILLLISLWFSLMPLKSNAQILTDTLWAVPELDGRISYRPASGIYFLSTSTTYYTIGDGWDGLLWEEVFIRAFLSFDLSVLNYADSLEIDRAFVCIYQHECAGNNQQGVYPIWDVAGGDTHFCVLDHINYGSSLDFGDWTAGDPGDPQTLQTNIGIISADSILEYKTLEVTPWLKQDIADSLVYNQYRLRFTIDTDNDTLNDWILFISGNSLYYKPYMVVKYKNINKINEKNNTDLSFQLSQNYPNPFNPVTFINFQVPAKELVKIEIFNSLGEKVKTLINSVFTPGYYSIQWDGKDKSGNSISSGIYFYKMQAGKFINTKKMIYMR